MSSRRDDARRRWLTLALVLVAFALRAWRLDGQGLWSDESISLERSTQPVGAMIAAMPVEHAPLYFLLLNLWLRVAGTTDFALRFPSLWFGVLAVPLLAALGRRAMGLGAGLLAALLLAINPLHVWHAQDARMYTMATALGLGALVAVAEAVRSGSRRAWGAYAVLAALTLYTHYYGGLIVAIAAAYAGVTAVRRDARPFLLSHAAIALLFLPWLPRALGVLDFAGWRDPLDPAAVPAALAVRFFLGPSVPAEKGARVALGFVALATIGLAAVVGDLWRGRGREIDKHRSRHAEGGWLLVVGVGLLVASIAGILAWKGDLHERYFLPATPLLYVSAAGGIAALRSARVPGARLAALGALALVVAASGRSLRHHYFDVAYSKPDYRDFTRHILATGQHEDALFLLGPGRFLTARYGGEDLPRIYNLLSTRNRELSPDEVEALLAEVAAERRRVWLAVEGRDPGAVKDWLDAHGYLVEGGWRVGIMLFYYAFPAAEPPAMDAVRVAPALAAGEQLTFGLAPPRPVAGGIAHVRLAWRTRRTDLPPDPQVSLRLVDARGNTRVAWDGDLVASEIDTSAPGGDSGTRDLAARAGLRVPADAIPGRYRLVAIVYRRDDLSPIVEAELGDVVVVSAEVAAPSSR